MRLFAILTLLTLSAALGLAVPPDKPDPVKDAELPPKVKAVPKPPPEKGEIRPHPTPDSGARAALADANQSPFLDSPFWRYLWIPSTDEEDFKATVLSLNYVSRSSFLYRPEAIPSPGGVLVRVDLRAIFPREQDLDEGSKAWNELAFDPAFSLLLTKDVLELRGFDVDAFEDFDPILSDVLRLDAPDLDSGVMTSLRSLTQSEAPITDYRYFVFRALSTVQDKGAYKTIFGGLYYQLRGIRKANKEQKDKGATDEDVYFEQLGIGNIAARDTYERLIDRVRGDVRPSLFISDVTGKPRSVVGFHTPAEREGGGWGAVTWDIKDQDIDVRSHPVLSQIKPKIAAQEAIFPGTNGMPVYALFNGDGALQDEAPPDVVADRTVPTPHTTRLQGAISCIRCHSNDGWQDLRDDLALLFSAGRLVPVADVAKKDDFGSDVQDRLFGLHSVIPGQENRPRQKRVLDRILARAREDFMLTVAEATGDWKRLGGRQTEVAKTATAKISEIYGQFWYAPVDARSALLDIGLDVPAAEAAKVLDRLLPPEGGEQVLGVVFEDARAEALAAGQKIGRADWSLVRSFVAGRANRAAKELIRGKP